MAPITFTPRIPFVDLAAQYAAIENEVDAAIAGVLQRTDFILGREVEQFEEEFANYCEVDYAVGVDSGTSALELVLRAFDIGPGDEVITAANSFIASALAISYTGATPVLVDIEPVTYGMDPAQVEAAITSRTKAILPVHLYGHPAAMDALLGLALRHGLVVIEDACQAHGARWKGRRVGSLGHAAAFSFYPAKNLGAYGDGGMVTTNDAGVAEAVRRLRNYGQEAKYHHVVCGYNRRLDTLQAAALRVKLRYLDEWNGARRRHARLYDALLSAALSIVKPVEAADVESVYHLYVIRSSERDRLKTYLTENGIATGVHYPIPIHLQPAYAALGYGAGDFPVTERCAHQVLSLPMYPELGAAAITAVAAAVVDFAGSFPAETLSASELAPGPATLSFALFENRSLL